MNETAVVVVKVTPQLFEIEHLVENSPFVCKLRVILLATELLYERESQYGRFYKLTFFFFFFILRRMGKNKATKAHHTSTYFHTRRVSI